MATFVLGAVGTALGGPLGGALGSLAGRVIDGKVSGSDPVEGPRLQDLKITTSSYGTPLPRHFGQVRVPGTIIWASDLVENKETNGGKGRPKTTTYSYSVSFAVALSSHPIERVGRIWADGELLRNSAGELTCSGTLRVHRGHADQAVDPLLASAGGDGSPAYRDLAYAVFEDLQLELFGNRVPALTFELFGRSEEGVLQELAAPARPVFTGQLPVEQVKGYSHEGGSVRRELEGFARLYPFDATVTEEGISLSIPADPVHPIIELEEPIAWSDGEFGQVGGRQTTRGNDAAPIDSIRYYDIDRDYQPGVQRGEGSGRPSNRRQVEFPATMFASDARKLANVSAAETRGSKDTILWRGISLDPQVTPGRLVRAPGHTGLWKVISWEWRDGGVELALTRHFEERASATTGASIGAPWLAVDRSLASTSLRVFELPPENIAQTTDARVFAAIGAGPGLWRGAALYQIDGNEMGAIAASGPNPATNGVLTAPLSSSPAVVFEPGASIFVRFERPNVDLSTASLTRMATGANRVLVGEEILQFRTAEPIDEYHWRLTGLLRGRGGTEHLAMSGHPAETLVTLLDQTLVPLDPANLTPDTQFSAISVGDEPPSVATLEHFGSSQTPLSPVHCRAEWKSDDLLQLSWTRRARGAWIWQDGVDAPLVEQTERYLIGIGDPDAPLLQWTVEQNRLDLPKSQLPPSEQTTDLPLWVRQVGTFGLSLPSLLTNL